MGSSFHLQTGMTSRNINLVKLFLCLQFFFCFQWSQNTMQHVCIAQIISKLLYHSVCLNLSSHIGYSSLLFPPQGLCTHCFSYLEYSSLNTCVWCMWVKEKEDGSWSETTWPCRKHVACGESNEFHHRMIKQIPRGWEHRLWQSACWCHLLRDVCDPEQHLCVSDRPWVSPA